MEIHNLLSTWIKLGQFTTVNIEMFEYEEAQAYYDRANLCGSTMCMAEVLTSQDC